MDSVFHYYNTSSIVASIFRNNPGGLEGTLGHWHKGWAKDGKNIKKTGPRNEKKQSNYGSFDEAILLLHLPSVFSPGLQCNTMVKVACFDALIW